MRHTLYARICFGKRGRVSRIGLHATCSTMPAEECGRLDRGDIALKGREGIHQ